MVSLPKSINTLHKRLKEIVGDPTDEVWFDISEDLHLSYDPIDPVAVECVTYLILKKSLTCPELISDWLDEKESFLQENLSHIYEAQSIEDYEELVQSGMEERPYIRERLYAATSSDFSYDATYDRIKNEIYVLSKEYAERKLSYEIEYCSTLILSSRMITCFVGIVLLGFGAFLIYKDYGLYQWSVHIMNERPMISRSYMERWNESCVWGGIYILGGIANMSFPFALKNCEYTSFIVLGKLSKWIGLLLFIIVFIILVATGSDFFWIYRPLG